MSEPTVCCIMLTRDRPRMAERAIRSFLAQTYERKCLLVANSGSQSIFTVATRWPGIREMFTYSGISIGEARNAAIGCARDRYCVDIIAHWDDDDWSHPNRIAEQVSVLGNTRGAEVTGYSDLVFWDSRNQAAWLYTKAPNETSPMPGTTLCYWRRTWEARPFPPVNKGEDNQWLRGPNGQAPLNAAPVSFANIEPRMIAEIHGGNTCSYIPVEDRRNQQWHRRPDLDEWARERMELLK